MASIKCPNCGGDIPDDELLTIKGIADVEGTASLRSFHNEGVIWAAQNSWDEEFKCPSCGKYFAPNFAELREKWKEGK